MLNSLGNRVENLLNWGDSFQWNIVSGILISFSSEKSRSTALKYFTLTFSFLRKRECKEQVGYHLS